MLFAAPPPPLHVVPSPPPALVAFASPDDEDSRPSLELLLRRARAEREARLAALRPTVTTLMGKLETIGPKGNQAERWDAIEGLSTLDPAGAELLVPWLDPGPKVEKSTIFRATEARRVLEQQPALATLATVGPLVELSASGTTRGRANALTVLGHAPAAPAVLPALRRGQTDEEAIVRAAAVSAAGRRPEAGAVPLLAEALADPEPEVAAAALVALAERSAEEASRGARATDAEAEAAREQVDRAVLTFAADRDRSAAYLGAVVRYYSGNPEAVEGDELDALLPLLYDVRASSADRIALLGLLADAKDMSRPDRRRALAPASESRNPELRDAARVTLALLGDRSAKRALLEEYDDAVSQRPNVYKVYAQRGAVYLRLRDYDRAVRDFKKGLDQDIENEPARRALSIALARAYSLDGKLSKASDALEDAWLSRSELRDLAGDPDFAELAEHPRYGKPLRQ